MPMPAYLSQRLAQRLSEVRKSGEVEYLRPDGKTQVTVRYEDEKPVEVTAIAVSTQHAPEIEDMSVIKQDMIDHVIAPVMVRSTLLITQTFTLIQLVALLLVDLWETQDLPVERLLLIPMAVWGRVMRWRRFLRKDVPKVDRSAAYAVAVAAKTFCSSWSCQEV